MTFRSTDPLLPTTDYTAKKTRTTCYRYTDIGPTDIGPTDIGPTDIGPNDIGPTRHWSDETLVRWDIGTTGHRSDGTLVRRDIYRRNCPTVFFMPFLQFSSTK